MTGEIDGKSYVEWAYRLLLGREPENENVAAQSPFLRDRRALVLSTLMSEEFFQNNSDVLAAFNSRILIPYFPAIDPNLRLSLLARGDPVRSITIALALETIKRESLPGDMAELGVYQGDMAVLLNHILPDKTLFLFDTFEGFPVQDLESPTRDTRFSDTSIEFVSSRFQDKANVVFRKGYFPDTASGLEDRRFCFVMLDADLYKPTLEGLKFFYPRVVPGGYIVAHDYTSYKSGRAVSRAFDIFLKDKPERVIEIPDEWGTVLFRRNY